MSNHPAEQLRRCHACEQGVMRCTLMVQHLTNGGDSGQSYDFECDDCQATVVVYSPLQMMQLLMTLPIGWIFGAFLLYLPFEGVVRDLRYGHFEFDFGGILMLCMMGMGLLLVLGVSWAMFGMVQNQRKLSKSPVIR